VYVDFSDTDVPDTIFKAIHDKLADVFGLRTSSCGREAPSDFGLVLKYRDNDNDLCTLTSQTVPDFLNHRNGNVLKLELFRNFDATAQDWEDTEDNDWQIVATPPGIATASDDSGLALLSFPTGGATSGQAFDPRTEDNVLALSREWDKFVHPRARDFFATSELEDALKLLVRSIDKNQDPVLGPAQECVHWHGDMAEDGLQPVVRISGGEEEIAYANRLLAFVFSENAAFEKLMKVPKEPLQMTCGNPCCVHLAHVSLRER